MLKLSRFLALLILFVTVIFRHATAQSPAVCSDGLNDHLISKSAKASFSDIDVLNYYIVLDITDFAGRRIDGYTEIQYRVVSAADSVVLFLEGLEVDSCFQSGKRLSYNHIGKRLAIALYSKSIVGDTAVLTVYYAGSPIKDKLWGGFYFSGVYAYNMGVGFDSDPHNYGRVWFPCVDNFTDKALYQFDITCTADKTAMCNGSLQGITDHGDGSHTFSWNLINPIPTYLASVAIAPYTLRNFTHKGIPVILAALKTDSADMASSFRNLPACIDAFIDRFGEHQFERIGFNVVPFLQGAMEHATNIAYPINAIDSQTTRETLYAHELAHHWWGNSVTCETPEDMWINEGWASYSENLFLEWVYGSDRYKEAVSDNHFAVLHYAHLADNDTLPVSGVDHGNTYGRHVYDKGADVVHTLRGYMGDDAFFKATSSFIEDFAYQNVSTDDLHAHFQKFTSRDLTSFFKHWVYQSGFPAFDILEWNVSKPGTTYENRIRIRQRLRFAPEPFANVPLELTAFSEDFKTFKTEVLIQDQDDWFTVFTPFKPFTWLIDVDEKTSDAVTDHMEMIYDTGSFDFKNGLMSVKVSQVKDSALLRVEHYWVGPDAWFNEGNQPFLSRERYWNVDGIWSDGFKASVTVAYNGRRTGSNYPAGYFDNDLIRVREDSLVLMYRATPSSPWSVEANHSFNMGSAFDKRGTIEIHDLRRGEYALAVRDATLLSVDYAETLTSSYMKIYPNPTSGELHFEIFGAQKAWLEITSSNGSLIHRERVKRKKCTIEIDTTSWSRGVYYAGLVINGEPYAPKLFIVR